MTWHCNAIDHGITFFPNEKIGPCCQISADYLKPIDFVNASDRFGDLKTEFPPQACEKCVKREFEGLPSYRKFFNSYVVDKNQGIVFLDIRNTNQCNLKCRYCGPHFSNQWAKELNFKSPLLHTDLSDVLDQILTDDLKLIYFTGGEPMISGDHWRLLSHLAEAGISENIELMYTTNLTVVKYKDVDFFKLWSKFSRVNLTVSVDSIGESFNYIRSGAKWDEVEKNLDRVQENLNSNINLFVNCVVSILNIWTLPVFIKYFQKRKIPIIFSILEGPDYLSLSVIPDQLKDFALNIINEAISLCHDNYLIKARQLIIDNQNQVLFKHCLSHTLLLDVLRNENLFEHLPFKDLAMELIANNHEYE